MSGIKQLLFQENDAGSLTQIAAALSGEVDGRWVRAPSPGCPVDDRSLWVRIDPARPNDFFIYAHEGGWSRARDHVREKLKLVTPTIAPSTDRTFWAMRVWHETAPADVTLVERYLRARGIMIPVPPILRFHPALKHMPTGSFHPAMVALVTDVDDRPIAIHRTYTKSH